MSDTLPTEDDIAQPPIGANGDDLRDGSSVIDLGSRRKQKKARRRAADSIDWPDQSDNGQPRIRSVKNFREFSASVGLQFRFNEMALVIEVQRGRKSPWEVMTDTVENSEWLRLTEAGCDMPNWFWRACAIEEAHRNKIDPGREYFANLVWDGEPRLDTLFIRHGGAPNTVLVRAMTRKFFIGAVRRMRDPGSKHDYVLVLDGKQGLGKSRLIFCLSPYAEWHCDSLEVGSDPKVTIEQTSGKFLVELAEMAGLGKRDIEATKAFVTRQVDRARPAYGRQAVDVRRRFVCIATVNADATGRYLGDQTGNRRWWPIEIAQAIDFEAVVAERDQLWAEAAHAEAEDEPAHLPAELERLAEAAQGERVLEDPWADALEPLTVGRPARITVDEVWSKVAFDVSRRDPNTGRRIANVMRKHGYEKRVCRLGGNAKKVFERVDNTTSEKCDG